MDPNVSVREARARLADILDAAAAGEPTVITRGGEPVAAVVSMDDYNALENAADELLAREADKILEEERGQPTHSMAEVLADIFDEPTHGHAA
ncbi:type II toxin-antitoxin system Phd/YefM family antitoxin [Streptomyces sp. JJ66]|uniref:type II toxin-antitoxin system Phd/YefM family antitoxin n=1 Tax=Streptomyces sp. JJ66 TaxID=2803843 RepID=UPI001C57FFE3|nr:type II toxin-antitoxin system Phd/YefM family antitoxin [Streptomyces sp. JJ66]MBW1603747.1 type II toxin-antitoxin system Phd/YefM family antitoxin [Streptomyces sp. JJ66]